MRGALKIHTNNDEPLLRLFVTLMFSSLVAFGAFYFFYVTTREVRFQEQNLRMLSVAGQSFSGNLETLWLNVRNALKDQNLYQGKGGTGNDPWWSPVAGNLGVVAGLQKTPWLGIVNAELPDDHRFQHRRAGRTTEVGASIYLDKGDLKTALLFQITPGKGPVRGKRTYLKPMLERALVNSRFDVVLLVDAQGQVLASSGNAHFTLDRLPKPVSAEGEEAKAKEDGSTPTGTHVYETLVAGVDYKVYQQPVDLPFKLRTTPVVTVPEPVEGKREGAVPVPASRQQWFLVGLIDNGTFRADIMRISPSFILGLAALVTLLLLLMPFLRILFIGPREGLKAWSVALLGLSLLAGCALLCFSALYLVTWRDFNKMQRTSLKQLSREMNTSFANEVSLAHETLKALQEARNGLDLMGLPPATVIEGPILRKVRTDLADYAEELLDYPYFSSALWIDEQGEQVEKWYTGPRRTPFISVRDRDYFQAALNDPVAGRYHLEAILSKTTGEPELALSMKLGQASGGARVSAMFSSFISLIDPVLPLGFGFAVIDEEGKVLFHDQRDRIHRENLFEELDKGDALRAMISAGASGFLSDQYRMVPVCMYTTPLTSNTERNATQLGEVVSIMPPWTLVVYTDKDLMRTTLVEILSLTIILAVAYFGMILFFLLGMTRVDGETTSRWYWPNREKRMYYRELLFLQVLLLITWEVMREGLGPERGALFAVIAALTSIVGVHRRLSIQTFNYSHARERKNDLLGALLAAAALIVAINFIRSIDQRVFWPALSAVLALFAAGLRTHLHRIYRLLLGVMMVLSVSWCLPEWVQGDSGLQAPWYGWLPFILAVFFPLAGLLPALYSMLLRFIRGLARKPLIKQGLETFFNLFEEREENNLMPSAISWQSYYTALVLSSVMIVGVLPTVSIFDVAAREGFELYAKRYQSDFVDQKPSHQEAMDEKRSEDQQLAQYQQVEQIDQFRQEQLFEQFKESFQLQKTGALKMNQAVKGVYTAGIFFFSESEIGAQTALQPLLSRLGPKLPYYYDATYDLRILAQAHSKQFKDRDWFHSADDTLIMVDQSQDRSMQLGTQMPEPNFLVIILALLPGLVVLWAVVNRSVSMIFLLQGDKVKLVDTRKLASDSRHRLYLRQPKSARRKKGKHTALIRHREVQDTDPVALLRAKINGQIRHVVIEDFHEGLLDEDMSIRKLNLLEILSEREDLWVDVHTEIDPLYLFTAMVQEKTRDGSDHRIDLTRWSSVLDVFCKMRSAITPDVIVKARDSLYQSLVHLSGQGEKDASEIDRRRELANECAGFEILEEHARSLVRGTDILKLTKDQMISQLQFMVEPFYRRLWSLCSIEEKLALYFIALDGFANWRQEDLLQRLQRRGLVIAVPYFRIFNESFQTFVLKAELPETIAKWQTQTGKSLWTRFKQPVSMAVMLLAVFFFATQKEVFLQIVGAVTALGTGLPALLTFLATLTGRRQGDKAGST